MFVARFDFMGVITRFKSENNFLVSTMGMDDYSSYGTTNQILKMKKMYFDWFGTNLL